MIQGKHTSSSHSFCIVLWLNTEKQNNKWESGWLI